MLLIQPIHQHAVNENKHDERRDAALLGEPEAKWITSAGQFVLVQDIGEEYAAAEADCRPDRQQNGHDQYICPPILSQ